MQATIALCSNVRRRAPQALRVLDRVPDSVLHLMQNSLQPTLRLSTLDSKRVPCEGDIMDGRVSNDGYEAVKHVHENEAVGLSGHATCEINLHGICGLQE